MTDITERLREVCETGCDPDLPYEAADEIDRLRARVADTDGAITVLGFQNAELRARVAELEAERADDDALRERMSDILKRTAIALRGPEPPLTAWSWHDLPERAAAAIASIDLFQRVAHNLADPRGLVPILVDRFLGWKLPKDFAPDGGITFTLISQDHPEWWPTGTCLLNAPQATAMFEYLLGIDRATGEECAPHSARSSTRGNDVAIDKDKVFELFGRYWEIAYNEGRTGEGFSDLANDVLAELRDALDADNGDVFTAELVEIDGHAYGLRPNAARIVREALRDAERYRWLRRGVAFLPRNAALDAAIDAAMAKGGA